MILSKSGQAGTAAGLGAGLVVLLVIFGFIIIGLAIFLFVFWILMIVDCATRKFKNDTDKIVWVLIVVLLGFLGAIIYYFVVKRKYTK